MVQYTYTIENNSFVIKSDTSSNLLLNKNFSSILTVDNKNTFCRDENNIISDAQKINYCDCIKDGEGTTGIAKIITDLNIFPNASSITNWSKTLSEYKKNIMHSDNNKSKCTNKSWFKNFWVKNKSNLNTGVNKDYYIWEMGLGKDAVIDNDNCKTSKTFGSYLDPLSKQSAQETWPNDNDKCILDRSFMKCIGFGKGTTTDYCTIEYTRKGNNWDYSLNINTPNPIPSTPSGAAAIPMAQTISATNVPSTTDINNKYYSGNKEKNTILSKTSTNPKDNIEKVKYIIAKEWGDNIQVQSYLAAYHYYKNVEKKTITMGTADSVVFLHCLRWELPIVYTGPEAADWKDWWNIIKKINRVTHKVMVIYEPSNTPFSNMENRYKHVKSKIETNNDEQIACFKLLKDNPSSIRISIGGTPYTLSSDFYTAIYNDMSYIQMKYKEFTSSSNYITKLVADFPDFSGVTASDDREDIFNGLSKPDKDEILKKIQSEIKEIQETYNILVLISRSKNGYTLFHSKTKYTNKTFSFKNPKNWDSKLNKLNKKSGTINLGNIALQYRPETEGGGYNGGTLDKMEIVVDIPQPVYLVQAEVEKYQYIFTLNKKQITIIEELKEELIEAELMGIDLLDMEASDKEQIYNFLTQKAKEGIDKYITYALENSQKLTVQFKEDKWQSLATQLYTGNLESNNPFNNDNMDYMKWSDGTNVTIEDCANWEAYLNILEKAIQIYYFILNNFNNYRIVDNDTELDKKGDFDDVTVEINLLKEFTNAFYLAFRSEDQYKIEEKYYNTVYNVELDPDNYKLYLDENLLQEQDRRIILLEDQDSGQGTSLIRATVSETEPQAFHALLSSHIPAKERERQHQIEVEREARIAAEERDRQAQQLVMPTVQGRQQNNNGESSILYERGEDTFFQNPDIANPPLLQRKSSRKRNLDTNSSDTNSASQGKKIKIGGKLNYKLKTKKRHRKQKSKHRKTPYKNRRKSNKLRHRRKPGSRFRIKKKTKKRR